MRKRSYWIPGLAVLAIVAILGAVLWQHLRAIEGGTVRGILTGEPCAPPCWQGIIPGDTVDRHAVIRQVRWMRGVLLVVENGAAIDWHWRRWPGPNTIYVNWNGIVQSIALTVDFELTVKEIIAKYGLPEAVNAAPFGSEDAYVMLNLYYPEQGFYCGVRTVPDYRPVLEPSSPVYEVLYTVPVDSIEDWFDDGAADSLFPWPGYGEFAVPEP